MRNSRFSLSPSGQRPRKKRRPRMSSAGTWLTVIALGSVFGCTGARNEAAPPDPILGREAAVSDTANRSVFLIAAQQKPRIIESLATAGIMVSTDLLEAGFTLRVTVGIDQGWRGCGNRNNVKYSLRRDSVAVLDLAAKGWTGTCTPNVFDLLSQQLAGTLVSGDRSLGAPLEP